MKPTQQRQRNEGRIQIQDNFPTGALTSHNEIWLCPSFLVLDSAKYDLHIKFDSGTCMNNEEPVTESAKAVHAFQQSPVNAFEAHLTKMKTENSSGALKQQFSDIVASNQALIG